MKSKKKIKRYKHLVLLLVLLYIISIALFEYLINVVETQCTHQETSLRERDFDIIWDYLITCNKVGLQDSQNLARIVEETVTEKYDLDELETKLNNGDISEFISTLDKAVSGFNSSSLVKNNRNSVIILEGSDKILVDRMVDTSKVNTDTKHTKFSDYYDISMNQKAYVTARRQLLNQTSTVPIMLEVYDYGEVENHILVDSCSYDNLKKVYMAEGIMGLHNYQFLCPSYITKDGDIFGNTDLEQGNPKDNHKFTVICTFNLYDQLIQMRPEFGDNEYFEHLDFGFTSILAAVYLASIVTFIILLLVTILCLKNYNDAVIEYLGEKALLEFESDFLQ